VVVPATSTADAPSRRLNKRRSMRSSGSVLLVRATAIAAAVVAAAAEAGPLDSPGARGATAAFCGYVDARNHGDFSKARSLTAVDVRWLDAEVGCWWGRC
jgi:hypothetical protein